MKKITTLKIRLLGLFLLAAVLGTAQTGNPYWAFPPYYWAVAGPVIPLPVPTGVTNGYNPANPPADLLGESLYGPSNMYADENGKPSFFLNAGFLYNKHGYLIDTLQDTINLYTSVYGVKNVKMILQGYSEACIVPNPANCQQYYVFTAMTANNTSYGAYNHWSPVDGCGLWGVGASAASNTCYSKGFGTGVNFNIVKPYFTLIDVSQQTPGAPAGELGKNIKPTGSATKASAGNLYNLAPTGADEGGCKPFNGDIHYAATTLINKSGSIPYRLLFLMNNNQIITYKITGTGSTGITWVSTHALSVLTNFLPGGGAGGYTTYSNITELEVFQDHPHNKIKVAFAAPTVSGGAEQFVNQLITLEYDTNGLPIAGGHLGNPQSAYSSNPLSGALFYIKGVEFSPDGNSIYVTHDIDGTYASSLDVLSYSGLGITPLSTSTSYVYSQIEIGIDGNLYLIADSVNLMKITNPNTSPNLVSAGTVHDIMPFYPGNVFCNTSAAPAFGQDLSPVNALPDQIDQDVYSNVYTATPKCCLFYYGGYDQFTYAANGATTQAWTANTAGHLTNNPLAAPGNLTSVVTIGEELRIPAGYKVTITNMTIKFSPQARLIIENGTSSLYGGQLVLVGCTLTVTNPCGTDMWPGVQVWGTPTAGNQGLATQGFINMTNSVIENAYIGILAGYDPTWLSKTTPAPPAPNVPGTLLSFANTYSPSNLGGGGVIEAVNCTFLNNQRAIVYYDFAKLNNGSQKLNTCSFLVNSSLLNPSVLPRYFVGMFNHNNYLPISGCSFYDSYNLFVDTGLYTLNSAYTLDQLSPTHSSFTDLLYGIYSHNTPGNAATISAKNTTFKNNWYGIYLGYVNNAIVETDSFRIYQTTCTGHCLHPSTYGLYLDNSTSYSVRGNGFTKYGTTTPTNPLYGIVASNTGAHANAIFNNIFTNLNVGSQAQFVNYITDPNNLSNPNAAGGLTYICNTFNQHTISWYDIYVPSADDGSVGIGVGSPSIPSGINLEQGTGNATGVEPSGVGYPVTGGNQFSHTSGGADFYIDPADGYVYDSYYTWSGTTGSVYDPITVNNVIPGQFLGTGVDCASNPYTCSGCRTANPTTDPLQIIQNQADALKQSYDSIATIIDGGNTQALLSLISGNNNAQVVYNSLNAVAPYLSDAVLKAYINSNYPTANITQLLSACSPLSNGVRNLVKASNLSAGIKTQLAALQNGNSKATTLSLQKSRLLTGRHLLLNDLIRTYLSDSIPANVQKGYALMKIEALELPARVQVETGIDLHDSVMAATALTQVANAEGQSNFVKLHTLLLQNLNKTPAQIVAGALGLLQTLATDSSDRNAYLKANTLLMAAGKGKYQPYIVLKTPAISSASQRVTSTEEVQVVSTPESSLSNIPNPFKDNTSVKAVIVEKTQNAYIVITDMVGNEIARYPVQQGENNVNIQAGSLEQAVMFCTLVVDGVKIKTNKMVLIK